MSTLTLDTTKTLDLTKYTLEQLIMTARKAEAIHFKQWTYFQFIWLCKVYLEIEKRKELLNI